MATQYAGGGRRSEAPTYSPRAVLGTQVTMPDDAVVAQLLQAINAPSMPQLQSGGSGSSSTAVSSGTPTNLGQLGAGVNMLGYAAQLAQSPDLAQMANALGKTLGAVSLGASVASAKSAEDVGKAVASSPFALSQLGVPGQLAGAIGGYAQGGVPGAVTSLGKTAAYAAAPVLGAIDAGLTLAGIPTVTDMVAAFISQAMSPHNPDTVPVTDLSIPEASLNQANFSDYGFSAAPDFGEGGWQSGTTDTGTTVGGPMSGDISGSPIGSSDTSDYGGGYSFGGGTDGMGD